MKKHFTTLCVLWLLLCLQGIAQIKGTDFYLQNYVLQDKQENVNLFISGDKNEIIRFVKEHAGKIKYTFGDKLAINISSDYLDELLNLYFVKEIDFCAYRPVLLADSMRLRNNIDSIHNGYAPLLSSYTGKGVIYGFIDTGIEFIHPDFLDSAGNTRVISIWDQSMPFDSLRTPPKYGYGQLWDSSDINAGTCAHLDGVGHGTNVAGCGAGNGLASGTHKGAAPDVNIIMVESDFSAPDWLATVADAVDYIYYVADSLNMPCVINASLGTYSGSHDGRDVYARFIDSLIRAKDGRLMVCAAGNSGLIGNYHLETAVTADTSFTWFTYNPPGTSALGYGAVFFEVWADTVDLNNVQFAVGADDSVSKSFRGRTGFFNVQSFIGTMITDTIWNGSNILGIVDFYAELQGDVYLLQVHMNEPDSNQYMFRFMTTGSGRFDTWTGIWMGTAGMVSSGLPSVAQMPDMTYYVTPDSAKITVSSFSCLESVITVGNYINNDSYIDWTGTLNTFPQIVGEIAGPSSRGPTRDNRVKPEVVSPSNPLFAAGVIATIDWMKINDPIRVSQDGWHVRNGGTSLAAPSVGGIAAMLLEKCPQTNWQEFKNYITSTVKTDSFTGATPNISYGYGKANGFRTLVASNFSPFISGDTTFCNGMSTVLSADAVYNSYDWSNGSSAPAVTLDSSQSVSLIVTNAMGCEGSTPVITVTEFPALNITVTQGGVGNQFVFASFPNGTNYDWYYNNSPLGGQEDDTLLCPGTGTYFVIVTDANGCQHISDTITAAVSTTEIAGENGIQVFPNPSNGNFVIETGNVSGTSEITIYNSAGAVIENFTLPGNSTAKVERLADGVYFVEWKNPETKKIIRIIITR